jgi:hypothetical protein
MISSGNIDWPQLIADGERLGIRNRGRRRQSPAATTAATGYGVPKVADLLVTAPSGVGEVQSHCCSCSHASKARWVDRYGAGRVPFFSAWLVIFLDVGV